MTFLAGSARTLRRLLDVALIGLIVVALFGVVLGKLLPLVGRQALVVAGPSMAPAIELGSAVVVEPVDAASLAAGNVISIQGPDGGAIFTHRIVRVVDRDDGRWLETKGDANVHADPTLVPATAVIGRVAWHVPLAGYLLTFLSLPIGVAVALLAAVALLVLIWLLESVELRLARAAAMEARGGLLRKVPAIRLADAFNTGPSLAGRPISTGLARHLVDLGPAATLRARPDPNGPSGWAAGGDEGATSA
jgi:signal peptidase